MTHKEFAETYFTTETIKEIVKRAKPYYDYFVRSANKKAALRALYEETDVAFTDIKEDIRKNIKCSKGCAHCCHIRAVCTEIEAEVAVDYAKEKGLLIDIDRLEKQKDLDVTQYMFSPHKRCVFLQADNTCGIYPVRPMACRKYFVVSDPDLCDTTKYPKQETLVVNDLAMSFPTIGLLQSYDDPDCLQSFPTQLLKALNK